MLVNYKHIKIPSQPIRNKGFTLVEMAIVLVVIGLILGMVFKGKELIDSAKVKNLAAQYNKILAATHTFYERYGFYPGDGCVNYNPPSVASCTNTKNGILDTDRERDAFWYLLIHVTKILPASDRKSVFGQDWYIWTGNLFGSNGSWLDLPGYDQADARICCALDKLIDDGNHNTGFIRTASSTYPDNWTSSTDCWSLSGQANVHLKVMP